MAEAKALTMLQERIQLPVDGYTAGMGLGWRYATLK